MEPDVSVYDLAENVDMVFNPGNLVVAVDCGNDGGSKHRGVAGQVIQGYTLLLSHNCPISLSNTTEHGNFIQFLPSGRVTCH